MLKVVFVDGETGREQSDVMAVDGIFQLLLQGERLTGVGSCNLYVVCVACIGEGEILIVVAGQIDGIGYRVGTHLVCLVVEEVFADKERQVVVEGMVGEDLAERLFQSLCYFLFGDEIQIHVDDGINLRIEYQVIPYLIVFAALAHVFIDT